MRKYLLAAAMVTAGANSAFALSSSNTFNVQVNIATSCIVGATAMNFATVTGTVVGTETANSTVSVSCNKGTAYALSFTNAATLATATTSASISLNGPGGGTIVAALAINAGATFTATGGTDTGNVKGTLAPTAFPTPGTYSNTQTLYVIY